MRTGIVLHFSRQPTFNKIRTDLNSKNEIVFGFHHFCRRIILWRRWQVGGPGSDRGDGVEVVVGRRQSRGRSLRRSASVRQGNGGIHQNELPGAGRKTSDLSHV